MDMLLLNDVFHLTALAITIGSFVLISSKRIIELCVQTRSE
ncbi:hypothetical protein [Marinomonas posidonica]|uniref:Uncharacterized protein n=1 Tax=Marinomonas posidonica (strain CECT 7376 / NCIMB 14433 / IVIA-Po-181) TaxID=491952 RepID=F6CU43_MARPP|nr:hypothetical protein [Marinomonas posidonica]AEF54095.1 hypothetical protein Mar181_1046 [Marinomonas posidonica IVIA-Po-181]